MCYSSSTKKGAAAAAAAAASACLTVFLDGADEGRVEVPGGDVQVLLMPLLIRPCHILVGDFLTEGHLCPLLGGLGEPIPVELHLTLLLQLVVVVQVKAVRRSCVVRYVGGPHQSRI